MTPDTTVTVAATAAVTSAGPDAHALFTRFLEPTVAETSAADVRRCDPLPVATVLGTRGTRTLPREVLTFLCAAVPAAHASGLPGMVPERVGLVVSSLRSGLSEYLQVLDDARTAGPTTVRPTLAPYTGFNAVAGATSIRLGSRGPGLTVAAGEASGLEAICLAVDLVLAGRAEAVLTGAVDVIPPEPVAAHPDAGTVATGAEPAGRSPLVGPEGAGVLVLTRDGTTEPDTVIISAHAAAYSVPGDDPLTTVRTVVEDTVARTPLPLGAVLVSGPHLDPRTSPDLWSGLVGDVPVFSLRDGDGDGDGGAADGALLAVCAVLALRECRLRPARRGAAPTVLDGDAVLCVAAEPDGRAFGVLFERRPTGGADAGDRQ